MAKKEALHNTYLRIYARLLFSVDPRNSRPMSPLSIFFLNTQYTATCEQGEY